MSKVIIYLDQNFISDIAKLTLEERCTRVNPLLASIYSKLKKGVDEEKFLSPDSWIQAVETAAVGDPNLQKVIKDHQGYLGQVSLQSEFHIKNHQFAQALLKYSKIENADAEKWRVAFYENPDKRMQNFNIKVSLRRPEVDNKRLASALFKIKADVHDESARFTEEVSAIREYYESILELEFGAFLRGHGITIENACAFIRSDAFCEIPYVNIFCKMWAKNFTYQRSEEQLAHDYNDISFLSLYLPYCNLIATDKHMKSLLNSLCLDREYNCKIYSLKKEDLKELDNELDQLLVKTPSANQSLFSLVCTKPTNKKMYSVDFLQMLNGARNKFERTGKNWNKEVYTSVFFTLSPDDKIEQPEPEDGFLKMTPDQWADMLIFGHNFKRLIASNVSEAIGKIPPHLRGSAIALVDSEAIARFADLRLLFYDIEDAIANKLEKSKTFGVQIVY